MVGMSRPTCTVSSFVRLASAEGGSSGGMVHLDWGGFKTLDGKSQKGKSLSLPVPCFTDVFVWLVFSTFQHSTEYMSTQPTPAFTMTFTDFHTPFLINELVFLTIRVSLNHVSALITLHVAFCQLHV